MAIQISRILHAGYIFECDNCRIAFDPIFENPFSQNCYSFPKIEFDLDVVRNQHFDAIFISHYHDDHFSLESLNLLDRSIPIYIFCIFEELKSLLYALGFQNVHSIELFKIIQIGSFQVKALEALDCDVDSLFHIQARGLDILNVVDSWIGPRTFEKLRLIPKWDLVLWPFQTMRELEVIAPSVAAVVTSETQKLPSEWLEQIKNLKPKTIVPSSCQFQFEDWSWYNRSFFPISYSEFEKQIQVLLPGTKIQRLNPGEIFELASSGLQKKSRLSWVKPIGDQNRDYSFNSKNVPQSVAEISRHLPALSDLEKMELKIICQDVLKKRVSELDFKLIQRWRLRVYDHQGIPTEYEYSINPDIVSKTWITEISETKLFKAWTEGESLTSIYVRVIPFDEIDPLEDPLIRCLYEGIIGGYQKAQLKRLLREKPINSYL